MAALEFSMSCFCVLCEKTPGKDGGRGEGGRGRGGGEGRVERGVEGGGCVVPASTKPRPCLSLLYLLNHLDSAIQSTLSKRTLSKPDTSLKRTANLVPAELHLYLCN